MLTRRRYDREPPTFAQTVVISLDVLTHHPHEDAMSHLERIKRQHLALGFAYQNDQIHRALRALEHRSSNRSGRWPSATSRGRRAN